jgi:O-glycosyl hydrolase
VNTAAPTGVTIDGFGGFGSMTAWWNNGPYYNDRFLSMLIDSLGLTMLRTELYPVPDQADAWVKQVPYLRAIKAKAAQSGEPFALYGTVWTAPASMKWNSSVTGGWPTDYTAYADYLLHYLDMVRDSIGYDLCAVSPVNESATCFGYNSMCNWSYPNDPGWDVLCSDLYVAIGNRFLQRDSRVPLSCCDHTWGPDAVGWIYDVIEDHPRVDSIVPVVSIHYSDDNVLQTRMGNEIVRRIAARRPWRKLWNTEFGGQFDSWNENLVDEYGDRPGGAWKLATDLFLCLMADYSAVIYWQLAGTDTDPGVINETEHYGLFGVVNGVPAPGPRFRVMQTVARHVRPGAEKVTCISSDTAAVWAVAYVHSVHNTVSVVLYNRSNAAQTVTLSGAGLPAQMNIYQTSPTQDHEMAGTVAPGGTVALPVKSLTTLYNTPVTPVKPAAAGAAAAPAAGPAPAVHFGLDGRRCAAGPGANNRTSRVLIVKDTRASCYVMHW